MTKLQVSMCPQTCQNQCGRVDFGNHSSTKTCQIFGTKYSINFQSQNQTLEGSENEKCHHCFGNLLTLFSHVGHVCCGHFVSCVQQGQELHESSPITNPPPVGRICFVQSLQPVQKRIKEPLRRVSSISFNVWASQLKEI